MTGAELITLTGEDEGGRVYPDDIFTGGAVAVRQPGGLPQLQVISGVTSWVKKNPVIAGALALAAVYLVYKVVKKGRR